VIRIAHRGGAAYAPENTLEACRHGIRLGADYLEVDVRQTRDGRLVLMHDSFMWRTTGRWGRVESLDFDASMVSFESFLALAAAAGVGIFPEVKGRTPGLAVTMLRAILDHGLLERCVVPSFAPLDLYELHVLQPALPLCQLLYPWQCLRLPALGEGVGIVSPNAEMLWLNPGLVREAHARGLQVWPWFGFAERWLAGFVARLGVDGMILNDPRVAL
jgi:glycerophosphoryl diester phosphodiesterase